jgi:ParB family transcriptional regulator, chromosome partitioning protein
VSDDIIMIPIERIRILNPRHRDRKKFEIIVQSIRNLGLKKPIQVSLRSESEAEGSGYDLICGQGRIEAFLALGHKEIPAIVVEITKEERLLRSLVENIARRYPAPMDLIREIERLKTLGYNTGEIATKLDIYETLVKGLTALNKAGEERLLEAIVKGRVPLTVAIEISKADTPETQRELLKAYEAKQLNFQSIRTVKRLMDQRRFFGKNRKSVGYTPRKSRTTAESMVNAFKRESQRQKLLIRKAKICDARLVFVVTAFDRLLGDDNLVTLLRAETLATMPKYLWSKLSPKHKGTT